MCRNWTKLCSSFNFWLSAVLTIHSIIISRNIEKRNFDIFKGKTIKDEIFLLHFSLDVLVPKLMYPILYSKFFEQIQMAFTLQCMRQVLHAHSSDTSDWCRKGSLIFSHRDGIWKCSILDYSSLRPTANSDWDFHFLSLRQRYPLKFNIQVVRKAPCFMQSRDNSSADHYDGWAPKVSFWNYFARFLNSFKIIWYSVFCTPFVFPVNFKHF